MLLQDIIKRGFLLRNYTLYLKSNHVVLFFMEVIHNIKGGDLKPLLRFHSYLVIRFLLF